MIAAQNYKIYGIKGGRDWQSLNYRPERQELKAEIRYFVLEKAAKSYLIMFNKVRKAFNGETQALF